MTIVTIFDIISTRIAIGVDSVEAKYNLTLQENVFLAKKKIVENIYSNARIEGCNVTFPETRDNFRRRKCGNCKIR